MTATLDLVTQEQIDAYHRDGVTIVRGLCVFDCTSTPTIARGSARRGKRVSTKSDLLSGSPRQLAAE